jgi:UDP-galactopyranose mutase
MEYDFLIVGAGLFGSTFAYLAQKQGKKCLVIDKRDHVGGNVYCENIGGINVHKYGAHIFHTNDEEVWTFVNSLVSFNRYTNSPLAYYRGELYNLPFNMNTFRQMWGVTLPEEALRIIESQRENVRRELALNGKQTATNLEEQARLLVGDDIYQKLIKGYTEKQWGRQCIELPEFIIRRLPLRFVYDNNYFADRYQGIPIGGYNKLIEALLQNVEIKLSTDYFTDRAHWDSEAKQIVYTGSIDQYFNFEFGCLEYRTVRFETEVLNCPNVQGNAVVNYTDRAVPYTRIIEHKHFEMFGEDLYKVPISVISREYSTEWCQGMEPYYPVNDERNSMLLARYQKKAESLENVIFGGRLAEYRYYDMAPVIRSAMNYFK